MTIDQMKNLKEGDVVVKVRKIYQNYDYTMVPCEPEVLTILGKGIDWYFNETVKKAFMHEGRLAVSGHGIGGRQLCEKFETLEDYINGNYTKDIILDNSKWDSLKAFLLFKKDEDERRAKKEEKERCKMLYNEERFSNG